MQLAYVQGLLTSVGSGSTTYGTISYHPNLLVSQIVHGNGVAETQGNDPSFQRRPSSEGAAGPYASWSSGAYAYDGAGNITRIGNSAFLYDKVSRLTSGTIYDGPSGGGAQKQQSYTFDAFGNLTSIAGTSGRATTTSAATNRLNGAGVQYDAAGNLRSWNGAVYQYDRFNQMSRMTSGGEDRLYLYTADDERIWSYDANRNRRNAGRPASLPPRPPRHPEPDHPSLRLPRGLPRLLPLRRRGHGLQPGHREDEVHRAREGSRKLGRPGG